MYATLVQRFINISLNTTQKFLCYFANDLNNDELLEHPPNFSASMKKQFPFAGIAGCFLGRFVKYFRR